MQIGLQTYYIDDNLDNLKLYSDLIQPLANEIVFLNAPHVIEECELQMQLCNHSVTPYFVWKKEVLYHYKYCGTDKKQYCSLHFLICYAWMLFLALVFFTFTIECFLLPSCYLFLGDRGPAVQMESDNFP